LGFQDLTGPRLVSVGRADLWPSDASDEGEDDHWKFDYAGHVVASWASDAVCRVYCKHDKCVWWPRPVYNGSIRRGTSIYMCWPGLGLFSWHFDILVSILSWANALNSLPTHLLAFDCDSWVRLSDSSALIIALHLEALWGLFCCGNSCYSWWLPPPRRLGAAVEVPHVLVIVRGQLRWLVCEGLLWFPDGAPNSNSSGLLVSLQLLAIGRFLWCLLEARCVRLISHQTTWCKGIQRGLACRQAREPQDKSCVSIVLDQLDFILVIGYFIAYLGVHFGWLNHCLSI
jgi:hypothetical protein